ncbi:MAG: FAD-dependent oxidoreductase [Candidatus Krumholzibacteriia bacterium]
MPRRIPDIAVIGAGAAGLACAERLAERGLQVQVFDKGRHPGGRIARRARVGIDFEHGAPGRGELVDRLTGRVPVLSRSCVTDLERTAQGHWRLHVDGQPLRTLFEAVVLAIPPAQAVDLLAAAPQMAVPLASVRMQPVLTALVGLPLPLGRSLEHIEFHDPALAEARRQADPATAGGEGWVLHATVAFSRDNLECEPDTVAMHLWQRFRTNLGVDSPPPIYLRGHRWRYGRTEEALGVPCLHDSALGIGLCGDWCLGDQVEDALASGRALAARMLGIPEPPARRSLAAKEGLA